MNIFTTSPDPAECAAALDDKRVVKMCLETAQMLSVWAQGPYKPTHVHHPCVVWAREARNWGWLYRHFHTLSATYNRRFGREHKSWKVCAEHFSLTYRVNALDVAPPPLYWPNCARNTALGLDFTHIEDVPTAYRAYLNARWQRDKRPPKWTNCNPPHWKDA